MANTETSESLAQHLVAKASYRAVTISTAESCTGGGIGAAITKISGSSAVFWGGIIAYDNRVKAGLLNVPRATLKAHGAVSAPVAIAMADGARRVVKTDYAVAVTGIAGPTGGTDGKPVGLVYIAVCGPEGYEAVSECMFGDIGREAVREATIKRALEILIEILE